MRDRTNESIWDILQELAQRPADDPERIYAEGLVADAIGAFIDPCDTDAQEAAPGVKAPDQPR